MFVLRISCYFRSRTRCLLFAKSKEVCHIRICMNLKYFTILFKTMLSGEIFTLSNLVTWDDFFFARIDYLG